MVSIVLAGGGTAGHTSPLIATAERLREQEPGVALVAIGTPKGIESRVIPAAGLDLRMIPPVPLPRKLTRSAMRNSCSTRPYLKTSSARTPKKANVPCRRSRTGRPMLCLAPLRPGPILKTGGPCNGCRA